MNRFDKDVRVGRRGAIQALGSVMAVGFLSDCGGDGTSSAASPSSGSSGSTRDRGHHQCPVHRDSGPDRRALLRRRTAEPLGYPIGSGERRGQAGSDSRSHPRAVADRGGGNLRASRGCSRRHVALRCPRRVLGHLPTGHGGPGVPPGLPGERRERLAYALPPSIPAGTPAGPSTSTSRCGRTRMRRAASSSPPRCSSTRRSPTSCTPRRPTTARGAATPPSATTASTRAGERACSCPSPDREGDMRAPSTWGCGSSSGRREPRPGSRARCPCA